MIDSTFGQLMSTLFGGFDWAVFSLFATIQNPVLNKIALVFSGFCSEAFLIMFFLFGLVLCCFRKTKRFGLIIIGIIGFVFIVGKLILNPLAGRIRPYNILQNTEYFDWYQAAGQIPESKYSFPSCHTYAAVGIATVVFIYISKKTMSSVLSVLKWIVVAIAFLTLCSRVYLMVHYPTDVLAGIILGILSGFLIWWIADVILITLPKWPKPIRAIIDIDVELLFKKRNKKISLKTFRLLTIVGFCLIWVLSTAYLFYGVSGHFKTCEYSHDDFSCMNKAKSNDYCDLHSK